MTESLSRRLTVILHADIAGSTALVQADETLAHSRIRNTFRRLTSTVSEYGGLVHEIRGDAVVAEFSRASDAVCAALAFQDTNNMNNAGIKDGVTPVLRIGISLSEVVVADGTVTGAGVVLAQRLEQLAEPGSVVVQGSVMETVPERMPFKFENLGHQKVKGIDQPINPFVISVDSNQQVPEPEMVAGAIQNQSTVINTNPAESDAILTETPAIAVLPFDNMSGDPEQDYFSDGITEDIITELTRFRSLSVVARNSSFSYKGRSVRVQDVASDLGAQYIVEGSVRKSGTRLRITAQLIEALTGNHVWAQKYDREMEDIFDVQDEVTRSIVSTLGGRLQDHQATVRKRNSFTDWNVYDLVLRAQELHYRILKDESLQALDLLKRAALMDPESPRIYSLLGAVELMDYVMGWSKNPENSLERAHDYGRKSIQLDNTDSLAHARLAETLIHYRKFNESRRHFEKALDLNPNDSESLALYSVYFMATGDPERSLEILEEVRRMDPYERTWVPWLRGEALFLVGRYADAITSFGEVAEPINDLRLTVAACHALNGNLESARIAMARYLSIASNEMPEFPGTEFSEEWSRLWTSAAAFKHESHKKQLIDAVKLAWPTRQ